MKRNRIFVFLFVLIGFLVLWALEWYGSGVLKAPDRAEFSWIYTIYPSLRSKVQDLGLATLQGILGQVKWRWILLCLVALYFLRNADRKPAIPPAVDQSRFLVQVLLLIQLAYLPDLYKELNFRDAWNVFYEPIHFWGWLMPSFPVTWVRNLVFLGIGASSCVVFIKMGKSTGKWIIGISAFIPLGWTLLLSAFLGFRKIDHTYATLYMGLWVLPFLVNSLDQQVRLPTNIRLLQAFVWGAYFFAGLEKLLLSGLGWMEPGHFQQLAFLHPTELNQAILPIPGLGSAILGAGLGFQLLSVLQWRYPGWGYVNLIGGVLFHFGNWVLFHIGGWQSPWIFMLIFLWPGWLSGGSTRENKAS